jgi:hypothetical protein
MSGSDEVEKLLILARRDLRAAERMWRAFTS